MCACEVIMHIYIYIYGQWNGYTAYMECEIEYNMEWNEIEQMTLFYTL